MDTRVLSACNTAPDLVSRLVEQIVSANPMQRRFLEYALAGLSNAERSEFNHYLGFWLATGEAGIEDIARSYNQIVQSMIVEQTFFRRNRRYRFARYEDVADSVYGSEEFMRPYMMGLAVSTYLWPNHTAISRFFRSVLPRAPHGQYLEVGPGHGVFFIEALKSGRFEACLGVDISATSIAMTRRLLDSGWFGRFGRYELMLSDFLSAELPRHGFDTVVMGEVLEHVERPDMFMARIRELCRPGAFAFVTTVVNAPAVDHIYLFEEPEAVRELLQAAGFRIGAELLVPYVSTTLDETMAKRLPLNVAFQIEPV